MGRTFRVSVYTPQDISRPQLAQRLWRLLNVPLIHPQTFGSTERAKINYDSGDHATASEIYSTEGILFVRGSRDSFTAMLMRQQKGWGIWHFWWDVRVMMQKKRESWLRWLFELCRELPPFYGFGCSAEEYDMKHTVTELVPGGSVTRRVGVSAADFHEFLPGLYWLTIFGTQLVDHFGSKLESLPYTVSSRLDSQVALILDFPVVPEDMDERLRIESELSDLLGAKYFFDRTRTDANYEAVPTLATALRDLTEQ